MKSGVACEKGMYGLSGSQHVQKMLVGSVRDGCKVIVNSDPRGRPGSVIRGVSVIGVRLGSQAMSHMNRDDGSEVVAQTGKEGLLD